MAGFHIVHDLYIELTKLDYDLKELYDYSLKEMLFILKYKREGLAYKLWRQGSMNRTAFNAKYYPEKMNEVMPELFEKKKKVAIPDWLLDDYQARVNKSVAKR